MNYSRYLKPFVIIMFLLSCSVILLVNLFFSFPEPLLIILFTIILFGLTNIKIKIPRIANEISITWPVTFFSIWLWGPWMGMSLVFAVFIYICIQIKDEWKLFKEYLDDYIISTIYNLSYCCLITCLPGIIFYFSGGNSNFKEITPPIIVNLFLSSMSCYIISFITTNVRIALFENKPPWKLFIDPVNELMELSLVSFSVAGVIIFNKMGAAYILLMVLPAVLGLYLLNFGIKTATEKDDISLLFDFASKLTDSLDMKKSLENIANGISKSINAEGCAIFIIKPLPNPVLNVHLKTGTLSQQELRFESESSSELISALKNANSLVTTFKESESIKAKFFPSIKGEISIAVFKEKGIIKGFILFNKNQFDRDHRNFLTILIAQATTAISNSALYHQAIDTNTQLKSIQAQLIESSKMTAVGQLASGVAHRLNSPFKTILNNFNSISSNIISNEKLERRLKILQKAIIRCIDIHDKIFHYTKKTENKMEEIKIWDFIDENIELLSKLLEKENIQIIRKRRDIRSIKGNPDYLSQVMTNLILNGRDALNVSGKPQKQIIIDAYEKNGNLHIIVEDNGTGMEKSIIDRIFEPFYTTKELGSGTGLGLSVSSEIVKKAGGRIFAESEPGKGAVFTVELPYNLAASYKL